MKYLLSGSFAYDTILLHKSKLEHSILPESLSRLNVSFDIDSVQDELGGTGGNIAYNASLLGDSPMLIGSLGSIDAEKYLKKLKESNLNINYLNIVADNRCAHAWILTDINNNQITSFNVGSMKYQCVIPSHTPDLWHLAPENPLNTAYLAKTAVEQKKSYFFDPGQCLPLFISGMTNEIFSLKNIIKNAKGIFVNDYEWELLKNHFKLESPFDLINDEQFFVKTLGSKGVDFYYKNNSEHIDVSVAEKIVDPTGCGDALRAGFLHLYTQGKSLKDCLMLGVVMGACAIEESGGQNHFKTKADILNKFQIHNRKSPLGEKGDFIGKTNKVSLY
jgi:adenosine kinase